MIKFHTQIFIFIVILIQGVSAQIPFEGLKEINGTKLYCKAETKHDEAIIVVHGGPGLSSHYLQAWFGKLSKYYTIIFYDQRSSGNSKLSLKEKMNFETFAKDLDDVRKSFGFTKIHVFGHNWGGLIAVYYAGHYSDHISSLILCSTIPLSHKYDYEISQNSFLKTSKEDSLKKEKIRSSFDFENGNFQAIEKIMLLNFKIQFCDTSLIHNLDVGLNENYMLASLSFHGFKQELDSYNFIPLLKTIQCPVFIMFGACDVIPETAYKEIFQNAKQGSLSFFENSGHFIFIEENKNFTKRLKNFIKTNTNKN